MGLIDLVKKHWLVDIFIIGAICVTSTYNVVNVLIIDPKSLELKRQEKIISELKEKIKKLENKEIEKKPLIDRFGIKIISPRQDASVNETRLRVSGAFKDKPLGMNVQLFIITDGPQYWPQDIVQFDPVNKKWSGYVWIGGEPPQYVSVMVALVGNEGRILCDYYKKVGKETERLVYEKFGKKEGFWPSLEKLTNDIVICDQIQINKIVRVIRRKRL